MTSQKPLIDPDTDDLNGQFQHVKTLKEVTELYLAFANAFYIDQKSEGDRERAERSIKLFLELVSPDRTWLTPSS